MRKGLEIIISGLLFVIPFTISQSKELTVTEEVNLLEKSVKSEPSIKSYNQLGGFYFDNRKIIPNALNKAEENYKKALIIEPYNIDVLCSLAAVYFGNGNFEEAKNIYQKALKLNPEDLETNYLFGKFLCSIGEKTRGIKLLRIAVNGKPDNVSYSRWFEYFND